MPVNGLPPTDTSAPLAVGKPPVDDTREAKDVGATKGIDPFAKDGQEVVPHDPRNGFKMTSAAPAPADVAEPPIEKGWPYCKQGDQAVYWMGEGKSYGWWKQPLPDNAWQGFKVGSLAVTNQIEHFPTEAFSWIHATTKPHLGDIGAAVVTWLSLIPVLAVTIFRLATEVPIAGVAGAIEGAKEE